MRFKPTVGVTVLAKEPSAFTVTCWPLRVREELAPVPLTVTVAFPTAGMNAARCGEVMTSVPGLFWFTGPTGAASGPGPPPSVACPPSSVGCGEFPGPEVQPGPPPEPE